MNDTIKVSSPADVIANINGTLGFTPTDSLVLVTLQGKHVGATLRLDLPAHDKSGDREFTDFAMRYIGQDIRATRVMAFLYTLEAPDVDYQPRGHLIGLLQDALDANGTPLAGAWLVTDKEWLCWSCSDCDQRGPLSEVENSQLKEYLEAARPPAVHNPPFEGDVEDITLHLQAMMTQLPELVSDDAGWDQALKDTESHRYFLESVIEKGQTSDGNLMLLASWLQSKALRDLILATIFDPAADSEGFRALVVGDRTEVDWERVDHSEQVLKDMLSVTPGKFRAPIFSLLGFIAWYKGGGSTATQYFNLALELDPGYELASLLKAVVSYGMMPKVNLLQDTAYGV